MRLCHFCSQAIDETMPITRRATCPSCSKELKICYNCRFYSASAHWSCLESINESVAEKDRSNFCDYFQFKENQGRSTTTQQRSKTKEAFDKLFENGR